MSAAATAAERATVLPGDDVVPDADVVLDTASSLPAPPADVWPWFVQLGERRTCWCTARPATTSG